MNNINNKLSVAVYRSKALPFSETFILDHLKQISDLDTKMVALKTVSGLKLDDFSLFSAYPSNIGKFRFLFHKFFIKRTPLNQLFQRWVPDLIHAHFATDAIDMLPFARMMKRPLVVTLHGFDVTCTDRAHLKAGPERWLYLLRRRKLFRDADAFLAVSHYIKQRAIDAGIASEKIHVHYLGLNLSEFNDGIVPDNERSGVLFVGRLVEKKRVTDIISAISILKERGNIVPLTIIGDGPLRNKLENQANSANIDVKFLGKQPRDRVIAELAKASVFCMPSSPAKSGDNEGLPIVYMEAQACYTPVVAYNQGPVPEAVIHNETGLLTEVDDLEALAQSILRIVENPELRTCMGRKGRMHIENIFCSKIRQKALKDFYISIT